MVNMLEFETLLIAFVFFFCCSVGLRWPDDSVKSDFTIDPKHEVQIAK